MVRMRSRHDPQSIPAPQARPTSRSVPAPRAITSRTTRSETPLHRHTSIGHSPAGRCDWPALPASAIGMILRLILIISIMRPGAWQVGGRRDMRPRTSRRQASQADRSRYRTDLPKSGT